MGECNYCFVKRLRYDARKNGNKIVTKSSSFMGGICLLEVGKNENIPTYKEPSKILPNGDEWYQLHNRGWIMELPFSCCC